MNKKVIIIAIITLIVITLTLSLIVSFFNQTQKPQPQPLQPTIPDSISIKDSIQLVSSVPQNNTTNVPVTVMPSLMFNASLEGKSPQVIISPPTVFTFTFSSDSLVINPQTNLLPATNYTITTTVDNQTFFLVFTTSGGSPTIFGDTRPIDIIDEEQEILKSTHPDIFLSNATPYSNNSISVISRFVDVPTGHFQFIVTSKNNSNPQAAFNVWAQEQGLTINQIDALDLVYN